MLDALQWYIRRTATATRVLGQGSFNRMDGVSFMSDRSPFGIRMLFNSGKKSLHDQREHWTSSLRASPSSEPNSLRCDGWWILDLEISFFSPRARNHLRLSDSYNKASKRNCIFFHSRSKLLIQNNPNSENKSL